MDATTGIAAPAAPTAEATATSAPAVTSEAENTTPDTGAVQETLEQKTERLASDFFQGKDEDELFAQPAETPTEPKPEPENAPQDGEPDLANAPDWVKAQAEKLKAAEARIAEIDKAESDAAIMKQRMGDPEKGIPGDIMAGRPEEVRATYEKVVHPEVTQAHDLIKNEGMRSAQAIGTSFRPAVEGIAALEAALQSPEGITGDEAMQILAKVKEDMLSGLGNVDEYLGNRLPLIAAGAAEAVGIRAAENGYKNTLDFAGTRQQRAEAQQAFDAGWQEINGPMVSAGLQPLGDTQKAAAEKRLNALIGNGMNPNEAREFVLAPYRETLGFVPQKATGRATDTAALASHRGGGGSSALSPVNANSTAAEIQAALVRGEITYEQAVAFG